MKLYFLRHGIAVAREAWNGSDETRPLTPDGTARMAQAAKGMARLGLEVDLILTSPLTRAVETADIAARALAKHDVLAQDSRLSPGFGIKELVNILSDHAKTKAMLLVGHEPDFSNTTAVLIGGGRLVMKKGGLALVEIKDEAIPRGELVWLLPPKVLGAE